MFKDGVYVNGDNNPIEEINRGKLQKLDTPDALIRELGGFAVDITNEETLNTRYFHNREDAIEYLKAAGADASLRATTLEDVFVDCAGRKISQN